MSEVDGATLMARSLKQPGIDHLFGVVGLPVGPIAAAAQKEGVAYIGMRNEQAASYAAQAYGYLKGRPGACIVVTGPGVVHGLAGLANAQQNCWPMILIGGASETYRGGMGAFQEERQVLIASPFCKFAHAIDTVARGVTVTVYSVPRFGYSLDILNPDAAPLAQALSRLLDAAQEARVVFEPMIEPVILGPETYRHSGGSAVSGDDDLLAFGFAQKPREIVFDLG